MLKNRYYRNEKLGKGIYVGWGGMHQLRNQMKKEKQAMSQVVFDSGTTPTMSKMYAIIRWSPTENGWVTPDMRLFTTKYAAEAEARARAARFARRYAVVDVAVPN